MESVKIASDEILSETFNNNGFVVLKKALSIKNDIDPFLKGLKKYVLQLESYYSQQTDDSASTFKTDRTIADIFASALAINSDEVIRTFDPSLYVLDADFKWNRNAPSPFTESAYNMINNPRITNIVSRILGKEVSASPLFHTFIKLTQSQLSTAGIPHKETPSYSSYASFLRNFLSGQTPIHSDAVTAMPDSRNFESINVWIPMTDTSIENNCLVVIPGSHKTKKTTGSAASNSAAVPLEVNTGDLVLLHRDIYHGSTSNTSKNKHRISFNIRYHISGTPSGRSFLPEFVVKSDNQQLLDINSWAAWANAWQVVLDYYSIHNHTISLSQIKNMSVDDASKITNYFRNNIRDITEWDKLKY